MSEEKKKEEKKKQIAIALNSTELAKLSTGFLNALKMQEQLNRSMAQAALKSLQPALEGLSYLSVTLRSIYPALDMMRQNQIVLQAIQTPALTAIRESQRQINQIAANLVRINQMAQLPKVSIPELRTALKTIPTQHNTLVRSLLSQIEYLETELAKEKGKNKELLALLDEKRKELKKQYVA